MSAQPIPDHVPADRVVDFNVFAPPGGEQDFFAAWKSLLGGPGLVWTTENGGHWIGACGEVVRSLWGDAERFSNEALAVTPGLGEDGVHPAPAGPARAQAVPHGGNEGLRE